jgi:hypothetical protein
MDGWSTVNCSGTSLSKNCTRLKAVNSINYYYLLYYFCTVPYGLHPCFVHVAVSLADNASRSRRTSAPSSNPCKSSDPLWQPFMSSGRRWTEPGASLSSLDFREPARNFFCGDAIEGGDVPSSGRCRTERRAAPPPPPPLSQFVALAAGSRRGSVVPSDLACP